MSRILVVEDDPAILRGLTDNLTAESHQVLTARDGEAGYRLILEQQPDLVILDLMLPDVHGYEVCKALRRLAGPWETPVLMLTAMSQPIDQLRGFAHGADAYLTKPFDSSELVQTVALLLGS